ncbi:hypothetical protein AGABI1DRAFT_134001 [Agaricus bisporus var. burnettii JB137-S8]|uniref:Uncharacterized protein n=1 Tax=Agaricus bisporus var. burnettii (strain JB137-S8 / ATCC MYA-4627 / FGSC 10392) TaxID=597362 RepID=K5WEZ3_AGABU|nr:uncharacterized protein AGABI1DRAFT_134001 [Agaricus bisporus var. burnettii JB137-S8]EKM73836.1 hypothetical protein AGABI1DRAFT_134001 [Agaricus bisporus var. burnettii JB137-S8]
MSSDSDPYIDENFLGRMVTTPGFLDHVDAQRTTLVLQPYLLQRIRQSLLFKLQSADRRWEGHTIDQSTTQQTAANGQTPSSISVPSTPASQTSFTATNITSNPTKTAAKVLGETATNMAGVTTSLSSADECHTGHSIALMTHDRVSLREQRAQIWASVVRFESRVTKALEIQEDIEKLEQREIMGGGAEVERRRQYMMLGKGAGSRMKWNRCAAYETWWWGMGLMDAPMPKIVKTARRLTVSGFGSENRRSNRPVKIQQDTPAVYFNLTRSSQTLAI